MARSPIRKARFTPVLDQQFKILQARLGLTDVHGGESRTLQEAVLLANGHLDLLDLELKRLKKYWPGRF